MGKTGVAKVELRDGTECDLWKDDESGELSISLPDPWDGVTSSKEAAKLGKALIKWSERMKRRGQ